MESLYLSTETLFTNVRSVTLHPVGKLKEVLFFAIVTVEETVAHKQHNIVNKGNYNVPGKIFKLVAIFNYANRNIKSLVYCRYG